MIAEARDRSHRRHDLVNQLPIVFADDPRDQERIDDEPDADNEQSDGSDQDQRQILWMAKRV